MHGKHETKIWYWYSQSNQTCIKLCTVSQAWRLLALIHSGSCVHVHEPCRFRPHHSMSVNQIHIWSSVSDQFTASSDQTRINGLSFLSSCHLFINKLNCICRSACQQETTFRQNMKQLYILDSRFDDHRIVWGLTSCWHAHLRHKI